MREDGEAQCGITTGTRRLTQRNRSYRVQYDLNVRVPEGVRLSLCTINGGEIEVRNTSGDFAVNNVNGRIRLIGVRGSGDAETVNGPVEAELLQVPRRDLRFKTVNGDVAVTWPRDLSADLRMKTMNGAVFTDFDVQTLPAVERRLTGKEADRVAEGLQHALGVITGRKRFADTGLAFGEQTRQQQRGLHLCARHRRHVVDATQPPSTKNMQRRMAVFRIDPTKIPTEDPCSGERPRGADEDGGGGVGRGFVLS